MYLDPQTLLFIFFTLSQISTARKEDTTNSVQHETKFLQHYVYYKSFNQLPRIVLDSQPNKMVTLQSPQQLKINKGIVDRDKPLSEFDAQDGVMVVVAAVSLFIAAGGGIGGGGVLVPLYILVGQFTTVSGVALSNVTVMGGALANLVCNLRRRNQFVDRPLIDWDLIMIMEGPTILGAILGGYVNKMIPSWMTGLFLLLLLTQMAWVLIRKGFIMYSVESKRKVLAKTEKLYKATLVKESEADIQQPLLQKDNALVQEQKIIVDTPSSSFQCPNDSNDITNDLDLESNKYSIQIIDQSQQLFDENKLSDENKQVELILRRESRFVPWERVLLLFVMFGCVAASDLLKTLISTCGSLVFWLLAVSCVPVVIVITGIMRKEILRKCALKEKFGVNTDQEVRWNPRNTIRFPAICSLAGLIAGMFGVGGGIVKAPLMLAMGVPPDVAAATSATMIFFTAGSACTIYISFGAVPVDYGITLFTLGFIVTLAGQLLIYRLVNAYGRRSYITLSMGLFMLCSSIMMAIHVMVIMMVLVRQNLPWFKISKICG
eukprot:TRINITY_DN6855_c0_g1_i9.p1 TRINITY_DN6855_c0_g1~~TRINITY_DN6855_c0_g1_i9.p1  ORF type:complete len:547 (-),score=37.48 TRINITY_DN6855_c0_g1_i9:306-1946(-)